MVLSFLYRLIYRAFGALGLAKMDTIAKARTARAFDLAVGERWAGPIFTTSDGRASTGTAPLASSGGSRAGQPSPS